MLTQAEADALVKMKKVFAVPETLTFPVGLDKSYDLVSEDRKEQFVLDVWRGTVKISKLKYQNRARKTIVLVRVDIDGAPHTNPDGQRIGGTHIHLYREGFESRWAYAIDATQFSDVSDPQQVYFDFCKICNIAASASQGTLI